MQHLQNINYHSSQPESKKIKPRTLNTIQRRHTICYIQRQYSQIEPNFNIPYSRKRSYSNSNSTQDQDSQMKEVYQISQDDQDDQSKKKQSNHSLSEGQSKKSSKSKQSSNKQYDDELNNIFESQKNEQNFRQFNQDFQLEVLQLEALYYQLSRAGFQRSAPLQIPPPYLSYYVYSLILYRSDMSKLFTQYFEMKNRDHYRLQLMKLQGQYFKNKLDNQCFSQVNDEFHFESLVFFHLDSLIMKLKFDYDVLLDDLLKYSQLSALQDKTIQESLGDKIIYLKNNIAIGNIRFVFKKKDGELINFKFPLGKFQDIQFYDYVQFLIDFAQSIPFSKSIQTFNQYHTEAHSERTMILFFLADIEFRKTIFGELNENIKSLKNTYQIENLKQISLEITTENRICRQ